MPSRRSRSISSGSRASSGSRRPGSRADGCARRSDAGTGRELHRRNWVFEAARAALTRLAVPIGELHRERGAPIPYVAILEADGDGVGKLVQQQVAFDRAEHIAQALYDFADDAWPVIRSHQGCAFYAAARWACWRDVRELTSAVLMAERVQRVEDQRGEP